MDRRISVSSNVIDCPNCESKMNAGESCPECDHTDDLGPDCSCAYCKPQETTSATQSDPDDATEQEDHRTPDPDLSVG